MRFVVDETNKNKAYILPDLTEGQDLSKDDGQDLLKSSKIVFKQDHQTFEEVYASISTYDDTTPFDKWKCEISDADKIMTRNEERIIESLGIENFSEKLVELYNQKQEIRKKRPL